MIKLSKTRLVFAIFFSFSITFLMFGSGKIAFAASFEKLNLPQQKVNPDSFVYPMKRLWEKFREKTIRKHETKVSYYEDIIEIRLSELGYVAKNKKIGQTQKASERFSYFSGVLTEYLVEQEGADEDKNRLVEKFKSYKEPLEELRDEFPANSSDWMLIAYAIDSLDEYSSKLQE